MKHTPLRDPVCAYIEFDTQPNPNRYISAFVRCSHVVPTFWVFNDTCKENKFILFFLCCVLSFFQLHISSGKDVAWVNRKSHGLGGGGKWYYRKQRRKKSHKVNSLSYGSPRHSPHLLRLLLKDRVGTGTVLGVKDGSPGANLT